MKGDMMETEKLHSHASGCGLVSMICGLAVLLEDGPEGMRRDRRSWGSCSVAQLRLDTFTRYTTRR